MSDKFEALKAKKPADTKSLKSQAAGYVTDDNSGGYYVVECQECGEVYPSQQSAGGGQIADTGDYDDSYCPHCGQVDPDECDNVGLVWNVQQAKINALLAALEEKDQELDKEGDILIDTQESMREWKQRANAAEQREDHLKADVAVMGKRIAELERANAAQDDHINQQQDRIDTLEKKNGELGKHVGKLEQRLQQPIKLPKREIGMACEFVSDHIVVSLAAVLVEAATAGFKAEVEGE